MAGPVNRSDRTLPRTGVDSTTPSTSTPAARSNLEVWHDAVGNDGFDGGKTAKRSAPATAPANPQDAALARQPWNKPGGPITQADIQKLGASYTAPGAQPPVQLAWTEGPVNTEHDDGKVAEGLGAKKVQQLHDIANKALANPDGSPATAVKQISSADLMVMLRNSGTPLEKMDPTQLQAAARYVNGAKDAGTQPSFLYKALDNLSFAAQGKTPTLTQQQWKDVVWNAGTGPDHRVSGGPFNGLSPSDFNSAVQTTLGAINTGGQSEFKVGDHTIKMNVDPASGKILDESENKKSIWGTIGHIALDVASVIPSPIMPFAIAANAVWGAVDGIKNKSWVGAIAGVAGAFAGGVGAIASVAGDAVSAGLSTAAGIAGNVAQVAHGVQSGINAFKSGSAGGIIGAVAGGAAGVAGLVGDGASGVSNGLQNVANQLHTIAPGAYALDAARSGKIGGLLSAGSRFVTDGGGRQVNLGYGNQAGKLIGSIQSGRSLFEGATGGHYKVQAGDTVSSLLRNNPYLRTRDLLAYNPGLTREPSLVVGQTLNIPSARQILTVTGSDGAQHRVYLTPRQLAQLEARQRRLPQV